jgi:hypothetical protein
MRIITPLPFALYISDGLIFELYNGGKPYFLHSIHWEKLRPVSKMELGMISGDSAKNPIHSKGSK